MQLIVPADALNPHRIDEYFTPQVDAFASTCGYPALYSLEQGTVSRAVSGETILYRGWMLSTDEYSKLQALVESAGGHLITTLPQYLNTHHIPNWYPLLREFTAETVVFTNEQLDQLDIVAELQKLAWHKFFLKDYVKSLKTGNGSGVENASRAQAIIDLMAHYRGGLEGGLCVRKFENLYDETRYFIVNGKSHAPYGILPNSQEEAILNAAAKRIDSPFFSADIANTEDGSPRLLEVGDGQVSDLVGRWTPTDFSAIFLP